MKAFVAICAKSGQRVTLHISKPTIEEAREELHKQGYSIIEVKEALPEGGQDGSKTTFYFTILLEGRQKNGQIQSSDIFNAYVKLVDKLGYQVVSICDDPNASEEEKQFITKKIRETHSIYTEKNNAAAKEKEAKEKEEKERSATKPSLDSNSLEQDSVLARKVAKYHALLERVDSKIESLLLRYSDKLEEDRVIRLKDLSRAVKQLKNTTNPDKLKLIGENVLERIGQLEIELLERRISDKKEELLGETNVLLKELGSSKKVVLPEEDFVRQAKIFFQRIRESYFSKRSEESSGERKTEGLSAEFLYYKNVRELQIYEAKRAELRRELLYGFFKLRGEKLERAKLKLRMVEQNIELLTNRIRNRSNSYVKIKRGISASSSALFYLIRSTGDFLLYGILAYALAYWPYAAALSVSGSPFPTAHSSPDVLALLAVSAFFFRQVRSWGTAAVSIPTALFTAAFFSVNF